MSVHVDKGELDSLIDEATELTAENQRLRAELSSLREAPVPTGAYLTRKVDRPTWVSIVSMITLTDMQPSNDYSALLRLGSDSTDEIRLSPTEVRHVQNILLLLFGPPGVTITHYKCDQRPDTTREAGHSTLTEVIYQPIEALSLYIEVCHFVSVSPHDYGFCAERSGWTSMHPMDAMLLHLDDVSLSFRGGLAPLDLYIGKHGATGEADIPEPLAPRPASSPSGSTTKGKGKTKYYLVRK